METEVNEVSDVIRRTIHLRSRNGDDSVAPKGGATVTCEFNKETGNLDFAIALCSKKDIFCKKLGRTISEGRLENFLKNPEGVHKLVYFTTVPENTRFLTAINFKVKDLLDDIHCSEELGNVKSLQKLVEDTVEFTQKKVVQLHPAGY